MQEVSFELIYTTASEAPACLVSSGGDMSGREAFWFALELAVCLLICHLAGAVGSVFTIPSMSGWYAAIAKPSFTPPSWLFAPVWLSLYTAMGVSLFIVWRKRGEEGAALALIFFAMQLFLNALWSPAFFGLESPVAGLAVVVSLFVAIAATVIKFYRISPVAAWILVPYLAWVGFAAVLNAAVFFMNLPEVA